MLFKNKKLSKLVRDPNLFFFDFFRKRIKDEALPVMNLENSLVRKKSNIGLQDKYQNSLFASHIVQSRKVNFSFDTYSICLDIVKYLIENTQLVYCYKSNEANTFKIICNIDQMSTIHQLLRDYEEGGKNIFSNINNIVRGQKHSSLYALYDEEYVYMKNIIVLEPWFKNNTHIFTYEDNKFLTHLDKRFLNKSVYSSHPIVLQGEPELPFVENKLKIESSSLTNHDYPVDVVITWVDGNDPKWRSKKSTVVVGAGHEEDDGHARYDQIDELRYCLRSINQYMPFVRNIFILTDDQTPWWLKENHEKVKLISHKELIDSKYLPTFNSHVIESYLHKIPDLSENFIYFNDDVFVWRPLTKSDFFSPGGISFSRFEKIKNVYGHRADPLSPAWKNAAINANNALQALGLSPGPSYHEHIPFALKKKVLCEMTNIFENFYLSFRKNKIRGINDISTVSYLYHHYGLQKGYSVERDLIKPSITVNSSNEGSLKSLLLKSSPLDFSYSFVCINDGGKNKRASLVLDVLNKKFSEICEWEVE